MGRVRWELIWLIRMTQLTPLKIILTYRNYGQQPAERFMSASRVALPAINVATAVHFTALPFVER